MPLPFCRCRSPYVRFRCRFVNIQRNWMETNFRSDERQAAQTSILDEANVAGDLTLENVMIRRRQAAPPYHPVSVW